MPDTPLPPDPLAAAPACFVAGTAIRTPHGERAVETLAIGELVDTPDGPMPIHWIGRRSYGGRFLEGNLVALPIRVRAGSLGGGLPRRDLLVSPCHAMLIDGVLVPADHLVNGAGIVREEDCAEVTYVHLELARHAVVYAEGALSETFLDAGTRNRFQNAAEYAALYPGRAPGGSYCAVRVEGGYALQVIRRKLRPPKTDRRRTGVRFSAPCGSTPS